MIVSAIIRSKLSKWHTLEALTYLTGLTRYAEKSYTLKTVDIF